MYNGNKMFAGAYAIIYLVIFLHLITNQCATRIILPAWSCRIRLERRYIRFYYYRFHAIIAFSASFNRISNL